MNHIKIHISILIILFNCAITDAQNDNYDISKIILTKIPQKVKIIGLGDPTHQEKTITSYRVELIKNLVDENNFTIIALEGNIYELYKAYKNFIQTKDILNMENAMYDQLNLPEMEELYRYVLEKDKKGETLLITGFDPVFSGETFTNNIKEELKDITSLNKQQKKDFLIELKKANNSNLKALFRNNKKVKSKIVHYSNLILSNYKPKKESDYFFEQALKNIVFLYSDEQNDNSDNLRDIGMLNNMSFLNKLFPSEKIILFGSSTHLLKNPTEINSNFFKNKRKTLGDLLNQTYNDEYYFIAYSGISGKKSNIFNKPKKLPKLNENSIEYKYKDIDLSVFLNQKNSNKDSIYCRFLGHSFLEINIWKVMDGLVLIKNISPAKIKN